MSLAHCVRYRRAFVPGGTFFFTVVTAQRQPLLASAEAVGALRSAFAAVRRRYPFRMPAAVVLPDHLHCIWTLPLDDADFATRWRLVKSWFTKHHGTSSDNGRAGTSGPVWQNRYWEHAIRDETDLTRHVDYIHFNPVKHGWAGSPIEWPFSSFRRHVAAGRYAADWGAAPIRLDGVGHE